VIQVFKGPRLPNEAIQNPAGSAVNAKFHENRRYSFSNRDYCVFSGNSWQIIAPKSALTDSFGWPIGFQMA
jgi:hypothetical protein